MNKKALWPVLALGTLMVAYALSEWAGDDIGFLNALVAVIGFVYVGYVVMRDKKGRSEPATEKTRQPPPAQNAQKAPPPSQPTAQVSPAQTAQKVPPSHPTAPASQNPPLREKAVFLFRKPRSSGDIKTLGTSWLGGLPALGNQDWPRDSNGQLMHHVLQVDLSEAGPALNAIGLPQSGSLAVFSALGTEDTTFETKLRYIPTPSDETHPPEPLSPIMNHTFGGHYISGEDPDALTTLPRWGLDLIPVDLPDGDADLSEALSAVRPLGTEMNLGSYTLADHLPNGRSPAFWHSPQLFARSFDQAVRSETKARTYQNMAAKMQNTLETYDRDGFPPRANREAMEADIARNLDLVAKLTALKPEMERRAAELMTWAFAHDPWEPLSPADLEDFKKRFEPFSFQQKDSDEQVFYKYSGNDYNSLDSIADVTLKRMATGPDAIFNMLPDAVRAHIDDQHLTPGIPHQMFGPPGWIQDSASEHEDDHLLFQIVHDDLIGLHLGDAGHIQIWLSPKELADGNFDAAQMTFECH